MTDHANELRRYSRKIGHPAGDVPSVMLAAADEIERLAARLEAAERERDECNRRRLEAADHFAAQTALMKKKYDDLRAKVAEMEKQEPVGWIYTVNGGWDCYSPMKPTEDAYDTGSLMPLYALPGAQAQNVPKAVAYLDLGTGGYMDIGTDLTDEALAAIPKGRHMLGIVGTYGVDGYVPAQLALSIPEGWKLVPIEPTEEMIKAANNTPIPAVYLDSISAVADIRTKACYRAMLAAAPEAKP